MSESQGERGNDVKRAGQKKATKATKATRGFKKKCRGGYADKK